MHFIFQKGIKAIKLFILESCTFQTKSHGSGVLQLGCNQNNSLKVFLPVIQGKKNISYILCHRNGRGESV